MTTAHPKPDRFDQALRDVQEVFLPAAQQQSGYAGFMILANKAEGAIVGISLWESEAAMTATGSSGGYYQERITRFSDHLAEPARTSTMEVVLRD